MNELLKSLRRGEVKTAKPNPDYPHFWRLLEAASEIPPMPQTATVAGDIRINFAEDGTRARELISRSNMRMTGKFPSRKNGRTMHWESRHELAAFILAESCPLVAAFQEQPAEFKFSNREGIQETHFPDLWILLQAGQQVVIEVKPEAAIHKESIVARTRTLQRLLAPMGYLYLLVLSSQLDNEVCLNNARRLLTQSAEQIPSSIWEAIRNALTKGEANTITDIAQALGVSNIVARSFLFRMILDGHIGYALYQPLLESSEITWIRG